MQQPGNASGPDGRNLIYLVSQPRSGSTMLQRLIGRHREVHTTSEPWFMLHPIRAIDRSAFTAKHDAKLAHTALTDFLSGLADGRRTYMEATAAFAHHLYQAALDGAGATFFLDKTPRYYMVLDRLAEVFPAARFVLLIRNPAAILASVYVTWTRHNPQAMARYDGDLLDAPGAILAGREVLGERAHVVHYEDLIAAPGDCLHAVYRHLQLDPEDVDSEDPLPRFALGDQGSVYELGEPQPDFGDRWHELFPDPQLARWIDEYLEALGSDTVRALGYDPVEIQAQVAPYLPGDSDPTVPLLEALGRS